MNKAITIIVIVLVVVFGGYFLFRGGGEEQAPPQSSAPVQQEVPVPGSEPVPEAIVELADDEPEVPTSEDEPVPAPAPEPADDGNIVVYTESGYAPHTLNVNVGDTVVFKNNSSTQMWTATAIHPSHRVYPDSDIKKCDTPDEEGMFDSCRGIFIGESWSFTFNDAGNWFYHDHLSPQFTGTIVVK